MGEYHFDIFNQVLLFVILAVSLNLLMGYAGQISIAHAAFAGVGAYTIAKLTTAAGFDFVPAVVSGVAAAFVIGAVVSVPALRLSVQHLILLTLAANVVLVSLANGVGDLGGFFGILGIPSASILGKDFNRPSEYFWLFLVLALVVFFIYWRLAASPLGRILKAIREDEIAARSLGKNVFFYEVQVFGLTAAMAGLAGALLGFYNGLVAPNQFNVTQSMLIVTMVVFGGMGNLIGPIVGAAAIVVSGPILDKTFDLGAEKAALWRLVIYGAALVVLMRLRPQGLIPEHVSLPPVLQRLGKWAPAPREATSAAATAGLTMRPSLPPPDAGSQAPGHPQPDLSKSDGRAVVSVQSLKKSFGGITAVDGIGFLLREGRITGLVGPNGAGKTTVFNLLTGIIPPDAGSVQLWGKDIRGKTPDVIAKMGMVRSFQDVRLFYRMTVLENVMLATFHHPGEQLLGLFARPLAVWKAERRCRERALECLSFVGMAAKANLLAGSLSYGEQKLVAIARLLATGGDVLLLDEPMSGLDPQSLEKVAKVILELPEMGKTVCIVEHSLHVLGLVVDHCYFMEWGRITAEGALSDLMSEPRLVETYFGNIVQPGDSV